jgi:hypothetical protein
VLQKVADVLAVSVAELRGSEASEPEPSDARPEAFESLRLTPTGHPAAAVVLRDTPDPLTDEQVGICATRTARSGS